MKVFRHLRNSDGKTKFGGGLPAKYLRNVLRIQPNFQGKDYADLLLDALAAQLDELDKLPEYQAKLIRLR